MLSILCVTLTIKVKVGIPESFKVGWYPPKKIGSSHLKESSLHGYWANFKLYWSPRRWPRPQPPHPPPPPPSFWSRGLRLAGGTPNPLTPPCRLGRNLYLWKIIKVSSFIILNSPSSTYHLHGKNGNCGWKSKGTRYSVWRASENTGCYLRRWNLFTLLSLFSWFGYTF